MSQIFIGYPTIMATGVRLATTGTSANAAIPNTQNGVPPRYVFVSATSACHIRFGTGTPVATNTDTLIQPGDARIFGIPSGVTNVAAIQEAAAGVCLVAPMENA